MLSLRLAILLFLDDNISTSVSYSRNFTFPFSRLWSTKKPTSFTQKQWVEKGDFRKVGPV